MHSKKNGTKNVLNILKLKNKNKMKQTAVEQFIEQLEKQGESWENVSIGRIQISIKVEDYLKIKEQAKEMEHEQIIDAYETSHISMMTAERYYNKTFNKPINNKG
jgi:hypothetical protein